MSRPARSRPIEGEYRYRHPIEIRFGDTDALGHVNNAAYLSYFEAARGGYYRAVVGSALGAEPAAARRTFVIAEAQITYRAPAYYGESLSCCCRVGWLSRSSFCLQYRVEVADPLAATHRLIADGSTVQVFYDLEAGRIKRVPIRLTEQLTEYEGRPLPTRPSDA